NLIMYRALNETVSSQYGIPNSFDDVINQPFVGMQTVKDVGQFYKLFNGEEVQRGVYKGFTERERWLFKVLPGANQARQLSDLQQTYQSYRYFNNSTTDMTLVGMVEGFT